MFLTASRVLHFVPVFQSCASMPFQSGDRVTSLYLAHPAHPEQLTGAAANPPGLNSSGSVPFPSRPSLSVRRAALAGMAPSVKRAWRHDAASKPGSASKFVQHERLRAIVCSHSAPCQGLAAARTAGSYVPLRHNPLNSRSRPEYSSDGPSRERRRLLGTSMVARTPL